jgi:hypothetical protein
VHVGHVLLVGVDGDAPQLQQFVTHFGYFFHGKTLAQLGMEREGMVAQSGDLLRPLAP